MNRTFILILYCPLPTTTGRMTVPRGCAFGKSDEREVNHFQVLLCLSQLLACLWDGVYQATSIHQYHFHVEPLYLSCNHQSNFMRGCYMSHVFIEKKNVGVLLGSWSLSQPCNHGYLGNIYLPGDVCFSTLCDASCNNANGSSFVMIGNWKFWIDFFFYR